MRYLILMTIVWAFSFSLIGEFLSGSVDANFAILTRVAIASLVFLPFTKFKGVAHSLQLKLMLIGAVQIGLMYFFFYRSFLYLSVPEVILFTVFTPIYITLVYDVASLKFRPSYLLSVFLAVLGAYILRYNEISSNFILGFLLVQGANICFAIGQSVYKKIMEKTTIPQKNIFGYFHFGALLFSIPMFLFLGNMQKISPDFTQWLVLIWLGAVASGIGYFLWNKGGCEVDVGILAIMNNALIPAALIVNLLLWHKPMNYIQFGVGTFLILLSLWVHKRFIVTHTFAKSNSNVDK
jgi:carboxylate/amino acid/amine transporter